MSTKWKQETFEYPLQLQSVNNKIWARYTTKQDFRNLFKRSLCYNCLLSLIQVLLISYLMIWQNPLTIFYLVVPILVFSASIVAQLVKNLPAMQETPVQFLGWEDPLEKGMATHFSILAWRIPRTEEPGRLQFMGSQRIRHDWTTFTFTFILIGTSWSMSIKKSFVGLLDVFEC